MLILRVNPVPNFLFLEAPPMGILAGVLIIANHKRALALYCYTLQRGHTKVFQEWRKTRKVYHIFRSHADFSVFLWEIKELPQISQF